MNLRQRSNESELMDDLDLKGEVVIQTLKELDIINEYLGGNSISLRPFKSIAREKGSFTLVDLGCGSAEILKTMAKWTRSKGLKGRFIGIDANPTISDYARENCREFDEIEIVTGNVFDKELISERVDIFHCCLFNHHFDLEENCRLLKRFKTQSDFVIINDLHRHPFAYYGIKWLTLLFSKSDMVKFDAKLSVAKGFRRSELEQLLAQAGIDKYELRWRWAFRWQLII